MGFDFLLFPSKEKQKVKPDPWPSYSLALHAIIDYNAITACMTGGLYGISDDQKS